MLSLLVVLHVLLVASHGHGALLRTVTSGSFQVLWTTDHTHVTFEVCAPTNGYIAFGFSLDGNIRSSDLVIGWLANDSRVHFYDCHWNEELTTPMIDKSQDYQLLSASKNQTHTILRFRRRHDTCDFNDLRITDDTMRFVYLWHNDVPSFEDDQIIINDSNNETSDKAGTISVFVFDEPKYEVKPTDDLFVWKVPIGNFSVPSKDTTYWCSIHQFTEDDTLRNYIGYNLSVPTNFQGVWHHMSLFHCLASDPDLVDSLLSRIGAGGHCFEDMDVLNLRSYCSTPMLTWALGSRGQALPDDVAMPFEKPEGISDFFMMEVHYNNPMQRADLIDDTVLQVFLSRSRRPKEAALFQVATDVGYRLFIPPNQKQFLSVAHCPSECTTRAFPEGVWIFAVGLHTHLLGRKLRLRHFRAGIELPPIVEDDNYDFNYQEIRHLAEHVQVLPGDSLTIECTYDSTSRSTPTFGGFPTHEEMCIAYPFYYPRSPIITCVATASADLMNTVLGIEASWQIGTEEYSYDPRDNTTINVKDLILLRGEDKWKDQIEVLREAQWHLPREGSCHWKGNGDQPSYTTYFTSLYPSGAKPTPYRNQNQQGQCGEEKLNRFN